MRQAQLDTQSEMSSDMGRVVLITTIDISPGVAEAIELRKYDDPAVVAHNFCRAHNMPESIYEPLAAHLTEHYQRALRKVRFPFPKPLKIIFNICPGHGVLKM